MEEKTRVLQVKSPPSAQAQVLLAADKSSDSFVAILIMPKSYLPLLERFSHKKIARKIEILPAKLERNAAKVVAVSHNTTKGKFTRAIKQAEHTDVKQDRTITAAPVEKERISRNAALLFFQAEAEKQARYNY